MQGYEIAALYIALNSLIFLFLTFRIIAVRRRERISLGDNEDRNLRKRIRSQANFTETTPIALIGLLALASLGAAGLALHILGASLTVGRLIHAHGMMGRGAIGAGRPLGMVLTTLVIFAQAAYLLYLIFN